jgi:hypothetical protein
LAGIGKGGMGSGGVAMKNIYCANFYCWEPLLGLNPGSDDFRRKVREIYRNNPKPAPSEGMLKLVDALVKRYPDAAETDETVWTDGTLKSQIIGQFINMGIKWWGFEEASQFATSTANRLGLHAYNPQTGAFYPATDAN